MRLIDYIKIFYNRAGSRIIIIFALILLGGMLEAIGVSMIVPVLSEGSNVTESSPLTTIIFKVFASLGIRPSLTSLLIFMVMVFVAKAILSFIQIAYANYTQVEIRKKLQKEFVFSYAKVDYKTHQNQSSGAINNIIVREVPRFLHSFMEFTRVPVSILHACIYFSVAVLIDWESSLALLGLGSVVFLCLRPLMAASRNSSILISKEAGILQSALVEYIQNISYFKATQGSSPVSAKLNRSIDKLGFSEFKVSILSTFVKIINEPVSICFLAVVIYLNVVVKGQLITDVLVLGFMLYRLLSSILIVQGAWQRFNSSVGGVEIVESTLKEFEKQREQDGIYELNIEQPKIIFDQVSLKHGKNFVIKDLSLEIPENKLIGIVGPSGAGKTSFFNLITGLLEPSSGKIIISGNLYTNIRKESLRKNIGFVQQDPVILNETMFNNIVMWRMKDNQETRNKVKAVMQAAGCEGLVPKLDEQMGERGLRLSGGEKQRLAIARELIKNPKLLILDEATSALDSYSEEIIQQSINKVRGECTIMLIAHRLSTVQDCDIIYVLNQGTLLETGDFNTLYGAKDSFFRKLCDKQGVAPRSKEKSV